MRLIENYLSAVSAHLPRKQRDDIEAELRSSLYEQLEERRAALQRDLTEEEQAAFLKRLGHPLKIAGEYAPRRYLIGPTLFPYYIQALKVVAAVVCVLQVVVSVVVAVATGDTGVLNADLLGRVASSLLIMGAFVTIGFAVMEGTGHSAPWIEHWNPRSLRDRGRSHPVDRGDLIINIITDFVLLLWWNGALVLPTRLAWDGMNLDFVRSGAWDAVFWHVNVLLAGSLALCAAMLWIGAWRRVSVALKLAIELGTAAVVVYLLRSPVLVLLEGALGGDLETVRVWTDASVRWALWCVFAIGIWEVIKFGRLAVRMARGGPAPARPG